MSLSLGRLAEIRRHHLDAPCTSNNAECVLLNEVERLMADNAALAGLLRDRDEREDTLNDEIAVLQARLDAVLALCDQDGEWRSFKYATWVPTAAVRAAAILNGDSGE